MQSKLSKFIATMLVIVILYANSWAVVSYAADQFLSENELESQKTLSKDGNVDFDVYYSSGKHKALININEEKTKLNIAISAKKTGYIKDATVDFSSSNFEIVQSEEENKIQSIDETSKKITFGQINYKEDVIEQVTIKPSKVRKIENDYFNKDNHVKLSCTFVNQDAKEIKIEQEIVINTEWFVEKAEAELKYDVTKYIPYATEKESKVIVQGKITSNVKDYVLPVKETKVNVNVPQLAKEYPEQVIVIDSTEETTKELDKNEVTYDEKNGKLTIDQKNYLTTDETKIETVKSENTNEIKNETPKIEAVDKKNTSIETKIEDNNTENNKIQWQKDEPQEFTITYIYSSKVYESIKNTSAKLSYQLDSEITLYGNKEITVKAKTTTEKEQKEKLGEIAEITAEKSTNDNVYKGYMYNNKVTAEENKRETEIANKYTLNIAYSNLIDSFKIEQGDDKFLTSKNKEYKANSYNKELKISKQEFDNLFGEDGKIEIRTKDGNALSTIDKDTKASKDEIKIDLSTYKLENISIETSKPKAEGNLNFEITKAIAKDTDYSTEEIKEFTNLKSTMNVVAKNSDIDVLNETTEVVTQLNEPTQKIGVSVSNDRWSTVTTNENVVITVVLENDSADDIMYVNPTFKVILPQNIEKLEVLTVQSLYDDGLKVAEIKSYDNEDGTKTIEAKLEGEQTIYNNPTAQGATYIFAANITLNSLTPTTATKLKVEVENGDENKTVAQNEIAIKYVAPTGVVTTNSVTGYNGDEKIEVINGDAKVASILAKSEEKELTFEMNVINNYENTLENISILGRTMFKGNKDVNTLQDLGTTMDIPLSSKITTSGVPTENVKIYYSTNGDATKDITDVNNNWSTEVTDYSSIKSYLIVLENYVMKCGEKLNFSYKAKAPANLDYNNNAYEIYAVYFKNNKDTGAINDKEIATKIGLATGKEAVIDGKIEATIGEGASVKSGENIEYIITVSNNGTVDANDTTISIEVPNNLEYVAKEGDNYKIKTIMPLTKFPELEEPDWDSVDWSKSDTTKEEAMAMWKKQAEEMENQKVEYAKWVEEQKAQGVEFDENLTEQKQILIITVGKISKNTTIKKNITFNAKHVGSDAEDETVKLKATIEYNEDMKAETNEATNIIKVEYFNVMMISGNTEKIKVGDEYQCSISVSTNDFTNNATNATLKFTLPDEMAYKSITYSNGSVPNKINIKGNKLEVNIGEVGGSNPKQLTLKLTVKDLPTNVYKKEVEIKGTIEADGRNAETIPGLTETINKIGLSIVQSCNIPSNTTISAAERYTYTFTVTNLSEIEINDIVFTDKLPEEVQVKEVEIVYADGTKSTDFAIDENGELQISLDFDDSYYANINIEVMAKSLTKDTTITNKGKIKHENIGNIESNSITHVIELFDKGNVNPDNPTYTHKVTGSIWIDANKDGIKDGTEERVSNVKVLLLDQDGNIAKNAKDEDCVSVTDSEGNYVFNNLNKGEYTAVFLYESSKYSATAYQKEGVDDNLNSDAVDRQVVFEGVQRIAAITGTITVSNSNVYNIDLGLIENTKFDLKLDKKVKIVTTNNGKEVLEHTYDNKLAKIDFESKYINQSSMVIEYSITVTNEGAVAGYAKKIADYIPSEFKFNSELNKDWYEDSNGTVYNSSLANTVINPGESKTVSLILTKKLNSEDFGIFTNSAEIFEASNNYGLLDIDSIPGNKATNEDDYSAANVVVGVKTGQKVVYALLTVAILVIIGTGIYIIKKKVLK